MDTNSAHRSTAEAFLAQLAARGVDVLYLGSGTDTAPMVEAYARQPESGLRFPLPVVTAHENVAVGMAHGYAMVTGRPQAVMLHVSVGAANAVCGLFNAARAQVPMLFAPGRTPLFESGATGARDSEIQWSQEMFDQAGMVRELVKWDYELRDGCNLPQVVDRALAIASAAPRGPVCLTLPREVLARPVAAQEAGPAPAPASDPAPDPAAVAALARALTEAKSPVIACTGGNADAATFHRLVELAERFGLPVAQARSRHTCFPDGHALSLGHDMAAVYRQADAVLYLESDVPWVPAKSRPADDAFVAHAACDPLFARHALRSHRSDLTLTTSIANLLPALSAALEACGAQRSAQERGARMRAWALELREAAVRRAAADTERGGPITKSFLSAALRAALPDHGIVVNEYPAARERMPFDEPGRYYVHPTSAGLGWGFPAALGVQQALPDKVVVAFLGDGAYLFANPAACHHASTLHGLPVVVVVFDNEGWEAVHNAALAVYPDGSAAAHARRAGQAPLSSLAPLPDFGLYAEASGGRAFRVERREDLAGVLAEAFQAVASERRQVLVHVKGRR